MRRRSPAIPRILTSVRIQPLASFHARGRIRIVAAAATVLLRYDLEKSNIPPTRPILASSPRHLHSRIFGDSPRRAGGFGNVGIGKLPVPRINPGCLSVFRRPRPGVIKYLLTFVCRASCFICQTVECHGNCNLLRHFEGSPR